LIIRALALRELKLSDWFKVFRRELVSGLALGSLLGVIGFFRIVAWQHLHLTNYWEHYLLLGFAVWVSLIGVVMFGTLAGSMLPFILRRSAMNGKWKSSFASIRFSSQAICYGGSCIGGTRGCPCCPCRSNTT
jgi:Mg/Co/Ni transporter MgtE